MMVVGYQTSIEMVRRGFDLSGHLSKFGPALLNTTFQLIGIPLFGGLGGRRSSLVAARRFTSG
jgi:hypothetical protein